MVSASVNSPSVMMILPELVVLAIAVAIEVHGVSGLQSEGVPFFFDTKVVSQGHAAWAAMAPSIVAKRVSGIASFFMSDISSCVVDYSRRDELSLPVVAPNGDTAERGDCSLRHLNQQQL
jgi:hypothetical protein